MQYKTEQEAFWAGEFGTEYISRNESEQLLASNLHFFSRALRVAGGISSCVEFGANIGINLRAIRLLYPRIEMGAVEINGQAANHLSRFMGKERVFHGSVFDYAIREKVELSLIKGVLIHINPDMLQVAYRKLYEASSKWILVCEYYNPTPVAISYRGHSDRLFKRDFAGEMMAMFKDLKLADYGFAYRSDPAFPQDDITWFLMRKDS